MSYDSIARVCESEGNYDKALDYCNKALNTYMEALGESHPSVAASQKNIELMQHEIEEKIAIPR